MITRKKRIEFVICVANRGYNDLERWKVYRILSDVRAADAGCLRVIDDSGEDYLYPAKRFMALELPKEIRVRLTGRRRTERSAKPRRTVAGGSRLGARRVRVGV